MISRDVLVDGVELGQLLDEARVGRVEPRLGKSAGKASEGKHRRYCRCRTTIDSRHNVKCWFSSRTIFEPSLHVLLADTELSNIVSYTRDRPQTTFESPVAATPPLPILSLVSLIATHHWPVSCITTFVMGNDYREA